MPRTLLSSAQRALVNCGPRSEVMSSGTPNLDIQPRMSALEQEVVNALGIGMASGQRVYLSTMVKR